MIRFTLRKIVTITLTQLRMARPDPNICSQKCGKGMCRSGGINDNFGLLRPLRPHECRRPREQDRKTDEKNKFVPDSHEVDPQEGNQAMRRPLTARRIECTGTRS